LGSIAIKGISGNQDMTVALTDFWVAAVERVPEIKPEQVEEVFFGNVLSAK
jgi:hypothetical protein